MFVATRFVPFEVGRGLATMIPNARFVPLESQNHFLLPHEKAWATFRNELNDFLNADEVATPGSELAALTERERELRTMDPWSGLQDLSRLLRLGRPGHIPIDQVRERIMLCP